jgi:predicted patatin/cPLA2 family phospholipase
MDTQDFESVVNNAIKEIIEEITSKEVINIKNAVEELDILESKINESINSYQNNIDKILELQKKLPIEVIYRDFTLDDLFGIDKRHINFLLNYYETECEKVK